MPRTEEEWSEFKKRANELYYKRIIYEESDEYKNKVERRIQKKAVERALWMKDVPANGWTLKSVEKGIITYSKLGFNITLDIRDINKHRPFVWIEGGLCYPDLSGAFDAMEIRIGAQEGYFYCHCCGLSRDMDMVANSEYSINYNEVFHPWILCKECDKRHEINELKYKQQIQDKRIKTRAEKAKTKNVLAVFNLMRSEQDET